MRSLLRIHLGRFVGRFVGRFAGWLASWDGKRGVIGLGIGKIKDSSASSVWW